MESPLFLTRGGVVEQQQQLSQQQQQLVPPPTREDETGEKNLVHWRRRVKKVKKVPPPLQWRRKVLKRRQRPLRSQPLPSSNEVRTAGANATSLSERERDARCERGCSSLFDDLPAYSSPFSLSSLQPVHHSPLRQRCLCHL